MKTTKKQYDLFVEECKKWIDIFGMHGYQFYFQHKDFPADNNIMAYCLNQDMEDRMYILGLVVDCGEVAYSNEEIRKYAFHEVMEGFLSRISELAENRFIQRREITEERHHIIRTLEKVIFDKHQPRG